MSANNTKNLIKYEYRCKICQMANSHPELFKELHVNVLEIGMSHARTMSIINKRIEDERLDLAKLNNQNMGIHFASHITIPERVSNEVSKALPAGMQLSGPTTRLIDVNPDMGNFVEGLVRRKVGNEVADYLNLDSLRAQMMEKLELLDTIIEKEDPAGGKDVNLDAMSHYVSLIKEIRSCIIDLNKIRSSKQLMSMMVKSLIEKQTYQTVMQLSKEYDQIKEDLLMIGVSNVDATKIDQQLRVRLGEICADTAKNCVLDILRQYKLS